MQRNMVIEAHRGDSKRAPENTLAAFRAALELGVLWIELDIHLSKDGRLVVIHDDTLDRTTNGHGKVNEHTANELKLLDAGSWFSCSSDFREERIPFLSEVIDLVGPSAACLNIEIKADDASGRLEQALLQELRNRNIEHRSVVSSFSLGALLRMKALGANASLAITGRGPDLIQPAREHGFAWIHAHHASLSGDLVAEAHRHGLMVNCWTVDDPATLPGWLLMDVDKLCTNSPSLFMDRVCDVWA